ncbi:MAG: S-methyl-5-thioribose-1-phosphate isomerase [Deltaproteobacteria bacterium]|nr:S-methyl-5-thioribose-1-phosphate isomerase [Deltaproteobacteria bacterium]
MTGKERISLDLPRACSWEKGELSFLDQTRLPGEVVIEKQVTVSQVFDSIKNLKVRGAPAIGIAGAYGLLVGLREHLGLPAELFLKKLSDLAVYLDSARPTAVNLRWALDRMERRAYEESKKDAKEIFDLLELEAVRIHREDIECCNLIGQHGEHLIEEGMGVLTHCNAGHLAVSELGTALAPMYYANKRGRKFKIYADETRPLLQGARLTSWELSRAGLDVTLICDNMPAHLMKLGMIQLVIVGSDRVAANGDAANKIGTFGVAILADYFKIPFYVACPYSTIDPKTPNGESIPIEQRNPEEVTGFGGVMTAPEDVKVFNPAFDVTPRSLIKGYITEKGIVKPPF